MSFQPTPKQALVLWSLLISGEQPAMSMVKPDLDPDERKELVGAGLIELKERKQFREEGMNLKGSAKHIVLTSKAWDWAVENFEVELPKSKYTKNIVPTIEALLRIIKANLQLHEISLATFLRPQHRVHEDSSSTPIASANLEVRSDDTSTNFSNLEDAIRRAYAKTTKSDYEVGVRLSELRQCLGDLPRADVDKTLRKMQLADALILVPLEDPTSISSEDERAALDIDGHKFHIVQKKR
ncbi:MAG: hypothetical protein HC866_10705 [Leptolyngbyaceae cyanobacterium RU_5_1]|nr:hypothetical protein [Leptolyngbyaceae cyanobacterium RU_5_1]